MSRAEEVERLEGLFEEFDRFGPGRVPFWRLLDACVRLEELVES